MPSPGTAPAAVLKASTPGAAAGAVIPGASSGGGVETHGPDSWAPGAASGRSAAPDPRPRRLSRGRRGGREARVARAPGRPIGPSPPATWGLQVLLTGPRGAAVRRGGCRPVLLARLALRTPVSLRLSGSPVSPLSPEDAD